MFRVSTDPSPYSWIRHQDAWTIMVSSVLLLPVAGVPTKGRGLNSDWDPGIWRWRSAVSASFSCFDGLRWHSIHSVRSRGGNAENVLSPETVSVILADGLGEKSSSHQIITHQGFFSFS